MDRKGKKPAAKRGGIILGDFVNWKRFKFVNCELGCMGKLLMYLLLSIADLKRYFCATC
jgi:hypothetical protein